MAASTLTGLPTVTPSMQAYCVLLGGSCAWATQGHLAGCTRMGKGTCVTLQATPWKCCLCHSSGCRPRSRCTAHTLWRLCQIAAWGARRQACVQVCSLLDK